MSDVEMIRCPSCRATNRVPRDKVERGLAPKCGRCGTPLALPSSEPLVVSDASFASDVDHAPTPVLLDAWAPWCGPCRMVGPIVDELARELAGRVRVAKLNVDENPRTAARFNLRSIPTLLVLRRGEEVDRIVGAQPKAEIVRRLQPYLG